MAAPRRSSLGQSFLAQDWISVLASEHLIRKKKKDFRDETLGSRGYNSCTRINHVNNDTLLQMCFITIQGAFIDITSFDPCCSSMRQAVIHHLKNEEFLVSPK